MEGYKGNKTFGKFKGSLPVEVRSRDGKRKDLATRQLNTRNKTVDRYADTVRGGQFISMEVNQDFAKKYATGPYKHPMERQQHRAAAAVNKQNLAKSPYEQKMAKKIKDIRSSHKILKRIQKNKKIRSWNSDVEAE